VHHTFALELQHRVQKRRKANNKPVAEVTPVSPTFGPFKISRLGSVRSPLLSSTEVQIIHCHSSSSSRPGLHRSIPTVHVADLLIVQRRGEYLRIP
jgi:hypothetical protein